jgi:dTDP-4-amino-4,6-dideoxygalactose transaminase
MSTIPFYRVFTAPNEERYLREVLATRRLAGAGEFAARCERAIAQLAPGAAAVVLTHSASAALEMACLLLGLRPGDEVILPSFTFASTANAVALRGAVPVFVDIRRDTLALDPARVEAAIGPRTRAILPVHYAGIADGMDEIVEVAARRGLDVIEDAAQGLCASWRGRALGTLGRLGALSFHETKNVVAGEGGALLLREARDADAAFVLRDKGTDRQRFLQGQVDKYTWREVSSSFVTSELAAAFLLAQLEMAHEITRRRREIWLRYHEALAAAESDGLLSRPRIPEQAGHNGHIYWLLLRSGAERDRVLARLRAGGIQATFHFVPLHDSPAGRRVGRVAGALEATSDCASRLLRLPLYPGLSAPEQDRVVASLLAALRS